MNSRDDYDEKEDLTFMERHKVVLSIAAVTIIAAGVFTMQNKFSSKGGASHKTEMVSVRLPAPLPTPPPPPPTPPPVQEMKQEKMVMQDHVDDNVEKQKDEPPPSAPISTGIKGNGPDDGFGVGSGKGNGFIGGNSRKQGKWDWYAGMVQTSVADMLRRSPQIRTSSLNLTVRIWSDPSGRITRAKLAETTSDPKIDQAIQDALTGIQLKEPPPAGMPLPIVMKITAKRPN